MMKSVNVIFPKSKQEMQQATKLHEFGKAASGEDYYMNNLNSEADIKSMETLGWKRYKSIRAEYKRKGYK